MRRYWLILVIFVAGCILLFHIGCRKEVRRPPEQEPDVKVHEPPVVTVEPPPAPEPTKKGPRIKFEKLVHDFGKVGPKTTHQCEFKFTNVGDDVLKLKQPTSHCTCTVGKLDKLEYVPGESGVLRVVKFRIKTPQGLNQQPLYITSNDKSAPKVKLIVKAHVVPKVAYEPKRLKLSLNDANDACPEIKVTSLDGRTFAIKRFAATGNVITADYDPSLKAATHVIQPKINTEKLHRRTRGHINITLTHPGLSSIVIPFDVLQRFRLKPPSIVLLNAEPEKPTKKEVWVLNNYGEDFEVESVSSAKEIIKVLSRQKIGNGYKFELEITPPADTGSGRFVDVLNIYIKGGQKLKVDCNGWFPLPPKKDS
jgi:hypothetical protein